MRLDHLLSKEQLTPSDHAKVRGTVGVQCCSHPPLVLVGECSRVEYQQATAVRFRARSISTPHLVCGWNVGGVRGWNGLLAHCWVLDQQARRIPFGGVPVRFFLVSRAWPKPHSPHPEGCVCPVVGVTGLLFGNCIVDASIL